MISLRPDIGNFAVVVDNYVIGTIWCRVDKNWMFHPNCIIGTDTQEAWDINKALLLLNGSPV
jgi:hypothetical protein